MTEASSYITGSPFFDQIAEARRSLGDPPIVWYRGHSHAAYSLIPTLLRDPSHVAQEKKAFMEFRRLASRLFEKRDNDWETLFDMQHYHIRTRLLDWSEALGVALAFLVLGRYARIDEDAAVFLLDPVALNAKSGISGIKSLPDDTSFSYRGIYWENQPFAAQYPIAVHPPMQNARMFAQRATFTVHGQNPASVESTCPDVVRKVVLDSHAIEAACEFVEHAGLDEYAVYPDIVGMSRHLNRMIFGG